MDPFAVTPIFRDKIKIHPNPENVPSRQKRLVWNTADKSVKFVRQIFKHYFDNWSQTSLQPKIGYIFNFLW